MKTSELTGAALNWAVRYAIHGEPYKDYVEARDNFSTCWNKAGPIMERERITVLFDAYDCCAGVCEFVNSGGDPVFKSRLYAGPTLLIAAMRCYVASKLGDEVEIPEELK